MTQPLKHIPLALQEAFREYRGALYHYLRRRLGNEKDARELSQEAFLRFIRLDNPERLRNPEAYIFRIAGNLLWEQRLRNSEESAPASQEEIASLEQAPFDFASSREVAARLHAALGTLTPTQRAVLILHLRDGLSFSEIAIHSGISSTMAKKHFRNALAACRKRLRDFEIEAGIDS